MAKRLSKGKRKAVLKAVEILNGYRADFWLSANGNNSITLALCNAAARAARELRQHRTYMAQYC